MALYGRHGMKWELKASHTPTLQLCGRGRLPFPFWAPVLALLHYMCRASRGVPSRKICEMWLHRPPAPETIHYSLVFLE